MLVNCGLSIWYVVRLRMIVYPWNKFRIWEWNIVGQVIFNIICEGSCSHIEVTG